MCSASTGELDCFDHLTLVNCRAIRFGYNILLLDADVTVFNDPYKYFKQPPFQDINVINQEENPILANGGVLYVQVCTPVIMQC